MVKNEIIKNDNNSFIMYSTVDGDTKINVKIENGTVQLTQSQMSELFQRDRSVITKHIANIFKEGELDEKSNVQILHIANSDKPVTLYNLDVIISVGYRVKFLRGTQFRIWANKVLKEYLIKGFAMNDDLLKQSNGGPWFPPTTLAQINYAHFFQVKFNFPPIKLANITIRRNKMKKIYILEHFDFDEMQLNRLKQLGEVHYFEKANKSEQNEAIENADAILLD